MPRESARRLDKDPRAAAAKKTVTGTDRRGGGSNPEAGEKKKEGINEGKLSNAATLKILSRHILLTVHSSSFN